jgi:hypothetical protein
VVTSLIGIDERLVRILPPKARLKLNRLVALAQDLEASFQSIVARTEGLREDLGKIRGEQARAITRAREITDREADIVAAANEYTAAIDELDGEIRRNGIEQQKRDQRRTNAAQLCANLRRFLEETSMTAQPLAASPLPPPQLGDHENPAQAVRRIRDEISKAHHDLALMQRAALPSAELRMRAREYVSELGKAGLPTVTAERGGFTVTWPAGCQIPMGTMGPGAAAIIAALFPDALVSALDAQIDKVSGAGLSSNERPKREAQLRSRIADLERQEEALIESYEAEFDLPRRPRASPEAVLGVKFALATAKAS